MKSFLNEDFLLLSRPAKRLYHEYAKELPIIDYHCHIDPKDIAGDLRFDTITKVWLGGDHYKWRLMRWAGIDERYITGDADDAEKFIKFACVLPMAIGNPLYHWSHLELARYFDYDGPLNADTAKEVYALCNGRLKGEDFSAKGLIRRSKVEFIGTTDDPVDSLEFHAQIRADASMQTIVAPTFRPDKAANIEKEGFAAYVRGLCDGDVDLPGIKRALLSSMERFDRLGCRASDHGLDRLYFAPCSEAHAQHILEMAMRGENLSELAIAQYKTHLMCFLGGEISRFGWVMQLHYNAQRNTNTNMLGRLGPDTGYDSMAAHDCAVALSGFLNELQTRDCLPKTIVYSLNPGDNAMIDSVIGAFQGKGRGWVQHGSAWWFNDSIDGMRAQMQSLAAMAPLGCFVGMLTDSRSLLSYARHEYFRRILCNLVGEWVERGEVFEDYDALGKLVQDISYFNAKTYFSL